MPVKKSESSFPTSFHDIYLFSPTSRRRLSVRWFSFRSSTNHFPVPPSILSRLYRPTAAPFGYAQAFAFSSLSGFRFITGSSPLRVQESSLFVPSFRLFLSPYPYGPLPTPVGSPLSVHRCILNDLFERLKHFLFRSFFLYFYYSTNFSFVKCFLKIFSKKLKKFFERGGKPLFSRDCVKEKMPPKRHFFRKYFLFVCFFGKLE